MEIKNDTQAFPVAYLQVDRITGQAQQMVAPGMTLLDYFAGQALTGLIIYGKTAFEGKPVADKSSVSVLAYEIAETMLVMRGKYYPAPEENNKQSTIIKK